MKLITILGPTAVGKTKLAVALANRIGGEIISADSRQVYKGMDIGTGKDLIDFKIEKKSIPYHLIDIKKAGEVYDLYQFQQDFYKAYHAIIKRGKTPILCGGTGMYLQAALGKEQLLEVPNNDALRTSLVNCSMQELQEKLFQLKVEQHNTTDLTDRERTIRAMEIEVFKKENTTILTSPIKESIVFGIKMEREKLRNRIKDRLDDRLKKGMLEEVRLLLIEGVSHQQLDYYGLEYRYISLYLKGEASYDEMRENLLQAIRRFAKKQMTWYRRMEKKGTIIHWIDAEMDNDSKLAFILNRI